MDNPPPVSTDGLEEMRKVGIVPPSEHSWLTERRASCDFDFAAIAAFPRRYSPMD